MKFKFNGILAVILIMLSLQLSVNAGDNVTVTINNKPLVSDLEPIIVDGRTLVPLRPICEAMECEVVWLADSKTANIKNETHIVAMQIGNTWVSKKERIGDGDITQFKTDVAPMIYNDSTYIPARALAEALDAVVGWDEVSRTVMIMYDTELKYNNSMQIRKYAGTGERIRHDGTSLGTTSFVSPESIDISSSGKIYVADSGCIRVLNGDSVQTIELEPSYLTVDMLRCYNDEVYALTNEFKDENDIKYYGLVRITDNSAEGLFITEAAYSKIYDFTFDNDGTMYVIQNNVGVGTNYLGKMDKQTGKVTYLTEIDNGITCLCTDGKGHIFLGNSVLGSIYRYDISSNKISLFAGVDDNIKFVDGPNAMFVEPRRMRYSNGYIYVLDYNILRRISVNDSAMAISTESIAGKISLEMDAATADGPASDAKIAPSYLMDFVVDSNGRILLTDPKNAVVRVVD